MLCCLHSSSSFSQNPSWSRSSCVHQKPNLCFQTTLQKRKHFNATFPQNSLACSLLELECMDKRKPWNTYAAFPYYCVLGQRILSSRFPLVQHTHIAISAFGWKLGSVKVHQPGLLVRSLRSFRFCALTPQVYTSMCHSSHYISAYQTRGLLPTCCLIFCQ